jgi:6-phosphofructokinase 1
VDDRILASRTGAAAVQALLEGAKGQTVGVIGREVALTPLDQVCRTKKKPDPELFALVNSLAC